MVVLHLPDPMRRSAGLEVPLGSSGRKSARVILSYAKSS